MDDPDWGRYFKENTLRERRISANRRRVLSGRRLGVDLACVALRPAADGRDVAVAGDYLRCLTCSDLIPVAARRRLRCSCRAVRHGPLPLGGDLHTPPNVEKVAVSALAPLLKWWQIGRRLGLLWT